MTTTPLALNSTRRQSKLSAFRTSPSVRVICRRILAAIPVAWGVTFVTFVVMNLLPGDAATALLGTDATPQQIKQLSIKLHLNESFPVRYWHWFSGVLHGDFGESLVNHLPVTTLISQRMGLTFELLAFAFLFSISLSVPLAVVAARRPRGVVDRITLALSLGGLSIAPFVLALLLILVFAIKFPIFPSIYPDPTSFGGRLKDLTLPAISFGFPLMCFYTRLLRADIVDQMQGQDYVLTARAKGLSPSRVLIRHATRNSLFGLTTVLGLNVGTLVAGTAIVESIFSIPGLGQLLLSSIQNRDVPVVEALALLFATFTVVANLLADLVYMFLDPRIRYGRAAA